MASMGKRLGKNLPKKGTSANSIKRFLMAEPEDFHDSNGLVRSSRGSGAGSAPRHRPETIHLSPVSSGGSDGERSLVRRSGTAGAATLPTTADLASMMLGLERTIKKEVSAVCTNLAQVLDRVEDSELRLDRHAAAVRDLQATTRNLTHRMALYKIEDQENHNRRNNIRIRGLPEATRDEDLVGSIRGIFNGLLGNPADHPLKLDRVHCALRSRNLSSDVPRDIICRVHYFEEK